MKQLQYMAKRWGVGAPFWKLLQSYGENNGPRTQETFTVDRTSSVDQERLTYCAKYLWEDVAARGAEKERTKLVRGSKSSGPVSRMKKEFVTMRQVGVHHCFHRELDRHLFVIIYRTPTLAEKLRDWTQQPISQQSWLSIHHLVLRYVAYDCPYRLDEFQNQVSDMVSQPTRVNCQWGALLL